MVKLAVSEECKKTYVTKSGREYNIIVRLKDDAYKNCNKGEIEKRKDQFLNVCSQLMSIALKK